MGKIIAAKQPCPDEACGSSDALQIYEDGTSFCFSCQSFFPKGAHGPITGNTYEERRLPRVEDFGKRLTLEDIKILPIRDFKERGISKAVAEFFGVRVSYGDNGEVDAHYYPYGDAYKIRRLPKSFSWTGKSHDLFGRDKFNGNNKRLVICEGEIDALSVAQASLDKWGKIYPVVGLSSSAMTKSILENRDWVRTFKEVVLCFDEDDAGRKALEEAIRIVGIDKARITKLPLNDANDVLVKQGSQALLGCIFDAAAYIPPGIVGKDELKERLRNFNSKQSVPYPDCIGGLNTKLKGHRGGEITLFISGTGNGKSTLIREDMLHVLKTTPDKIGVIALEESPEETARKLSGMVLNRNPAKEEIPFEELEVGFDEVFGDDRVIVLDHQGSMTDHGIVDKLEYMCLSGCKYLYIDHITMLVSEGADDLRGNEAIDKVMNDLLRLVKKFPEVWVGLISHLRKAQPGGKSFEEGRMPSLDDIKGSGSIKQVSMDVVAFARDSTATDDKTRNSTKMRVLKCRYTGLTGNVQGTFYNYDTGRLTKLDELVEDFVAL
jgi:twinkle protein